jgi:ABC-2 type transport system permease protein
MIRCFLLIPAFIRFSFQRELAFRFNFAVNLLNTALNLAGSLGGILVLFADRREVNGWSFSGMLGVVGVYLLIQAVRGLAIGPSLESLSGLDGDLWTGQFDFTLLKPLPAQFQVSFRNWSLWSLFDIALAVALILISVSETAGALTLTGALAFTASLLVSLLLVYSILLILGSAAFWYLGTPLMWIFDSLIQTGRFPVGLYPGVLRFVLTWMVPVGFIVTVPAEILTGRINGGLLVPGALLAAVLFAAAAIFFRLSLKRYSGASG